MTGLDRIHELVSELNEAIKAEFPDGNQSSITFHVSGRMNITVTEWGEGKKTVDTPRRELLDQWFSDGKWEPDWSSNQNAYYEEKGVLLRKEDKEVKIA